MLLVKYRKCLCYLHNENLEKSIFFVCVRQNQEMEEALEGTDGTSSDHYHNLVNSLAARHCEDTQVRIISLFVANT